MFSNLPGPSFPWFVLLLKPTKDFLLFLNPSKINPGTRGKNAQKIKQAPENKSNKDIKNQGHEGQGAVFTENDGKYENDVAI